MGGSLQQAAEVMAGGCTVHFVNCLLLSLTMRFTETQSLFLNIGECLYYRVTLKKTQWTFYLAIDIDGQTVSKKRREVFNAPHSFFPTERLV